MQTCRMLLITTILSLTLARGASAQIPQYWDTDSSAGIQGGNGVWSSSDSNWTTNRRVASAPAPWGSGNFAYFVNPSNGAASTVTLSSSLNVGFVTLAGQPYTLIVTNGGQMLNGVSNSFIGDTKTGNVVVITGSGSLWDLGGKNLTVGNAAGGVSNQLRIEADGVVSNLALYVGNANSGAFDNRVVVDNATLMIKSNSSISVGDRSNGNTLTLTNGALLRRFYDPTGASTALGNSTSLAFNRIVIAANCTWDNGNAFLYVGSGLGSFSNSVIIDGGSMTNIGSNQRLNVGHGNNSFLNSIVVTNGGFIQWVNDRQLIVGYGSNTSFNTFEVSAGGTADAASDCIIGNGINSWSNAIILGNGGVFTNANKLWVGKGVGPVNNRLTLNGGQLYVSELHAENVGNYIEFKGGLIRTLGTSTLTNGLPLVVGDGLQNATLLVGFTFTIPLGIIVTNKGLLSGVGPIAATSGVTTIFGSVNPGLSPASGGSLVHNGALTLKPGATVEIDLVSTNKTGGWDRLVVTNGTLTLGGTLKPLLQNGFLPAATNRFPYVLSNSVALAGSFTGQADGDRIPAYSNTTAVGTFRLGVSNTYVVLDNFEAGTPARTGGTLIQVK